tara:strand:- start:1194 stop:1742 length:549 start_codon:yes stop_codon:yes gene_type:complete
MNPNTLDTFNCDYCGYLEGNEEVHDCSITHTFNKMNKLKTLERVGGLSYEESKEICKSIWNCEADLKVLECGNASFTGCQFEALSIAEVIDHELNCCFGRLVIKPPTITKTKKVYSSTKATCETCGKVYLHTSKNITPINSLNRHQKSCEENLGRNLRGQLNSMIKSMSVIDLKRTLDYLNT